MNRLGRHARTISGVGFPPDEQGSATGDLPFLKVSDLADARNAHGVVTAANWVTAVQARALGVRVVPIGSVVFPKVGAALLGNARALTKVPCAMDNNMMAVAPQDGDPRYWYYAMRTVDMADLNLSGTIPFVSDTAVRDLRLPVDQPLRTQQRIADFLDDQVARIDNIIATRRTQIELIAEDLNSQIDRTTSEGDRRRLAPVLEMLRDGTHTPPQRVDLGVPLLTAKNVKNQRLAFTATDTAISEADADLLDRSFAPRSGDVLVSVKGSVGNVAVVPDGSPRFQVERNLAVLRPSRQVIVPKWLYWCLRGRRVQEQIRLAMGFSAQPGIYLGDLASLIIEVPDVGTQASRASALDASSESTLSATAALRSSIDLLSALKRSLITAAVTGEFDVSAADGSRVPA